ncbi:exodeoxyribonuclease VII large subunit [Motilimonas pumila]|uniref:Exodeoxyribonuclease 7 large subunit n=1 Tax=Motilimonas pumila TaxID=2303987 RepID=A0A418YB87_9GAMM|nr:exodeoxyribonuclease VII large subunit [Motilimonas pumila]RJG40250.1 exodeoxyribonuclease VII large subunit [Motilimonas pumila]
MNSVYSVSHLNRAVKQLLESGLGTVWLSGEISNLAMAASGHWYLTLKDSQAQVKAAMFRGANRKVSFKPANGMQVLVRAKLSLYEPRGDYQLIIESMAPEGDGLLQQEFEQLKMRLAAEGLFANQHKQTLPSMPKSVGIITSATGAALHDIVSVLKRRNPALSIIVYPSQVQGKAATQSLVQALTLANTRNEVDVLVFGRGGGSLEDLWCFNEADVARAIFNSRIPIISAVGHEVDVTISDFVADVRAATPSAAAEILSQSAEQWQQQIRTLENQLVATLQLRLSKHKQTLLHLEQKMQQYSPQTQLQMQSQRCDELTMRLHQSMQRQLTQGDKRLAMAEAKLKQFSPQQTLQQYRLRHQQAKQRLSQAMQVLLSQKQSQQHQQMQQLNTVSPLATLSRGYSISSDKQGKLIRSTAQVNSGERITTQVTDGIITSEVVSKKLTK